MGTNYYFEYSKDNRADHIGKKVFNGRGKGNTFIWALPKRTAFHICEAYWDRLVVRGVGEGLMSGADFIKMASRCDVDDISQVGKDFT